LDPDPPKELRRTLDAIRYLESKTGAFEGEGLVLRYGAFYGPGTGMLDRSIIDQLRRRRVPLIGEANGWWSFLHIDDAAAATAIAIERGAAGIYNIPLKSSTIASPHNANMLWQPGRPRFFLGMETARTGDGK
jgi:nucleoside-diphosphate-sugar epimerase